MRPFRDLSRRGRLSRLRKLALTAIEAYKLEGARLSFIQYFENIIYRVDLTGSNTLTGSADPYVSNRYVLHIHAMSDADAIASELTWLAALNQQAGLPVPAPVLTPDGKLLTTIITPGMPKGRVVSLMRWLDGRRYRKGLQPKHLTALGQVVAQLHTFSAGGSLPQGSPAHIGIGIRSLVGACLNTPWKRWLIPYLPNSSSLSSLYPRKLNGLWNPLVKVLMFMA